MLTDDEKKLMQDSLHALRVSLPGFSVRRPQLKMMAEVAHALASIGTDEVSPMQNRRIAVIEAGTGTGKTIGYLLPALVLARSRGRKLVVSSSTVALQEQLIAKDLPALQRHLPFAFRCALTKGRRRYVCPAKLIGLAAQRTVVAVDEQLAHQESRSVRLEGRLAQAFARGSWSGDRDEWSDAIPDALWHRLSTDRDGCLGTRCTEYSRCPFQRIRDDMEKADVVIANHDLVLAALEMEPGALLPDPTKTLFVLDEAHGLPAKAATRSAARHAVLGATHWIKDAGALAAEARRDLRMDGALGARVAEHGKRLCATLAQLHATLERHCDFDGEGVIHRFALGVLPVEVEEHGVGVRDAASAFHVALVALRDALLERAQRRVVVAQPYVAAVGVYIGNAQQLIATWDIMLRTQVGDAKPVARWVEQGARIGRKVDFRVCAAPISGGQCLRELLWQRAGAVVLTSATLRACGTFDLFLEESGLDTCTGVYSMTLPSPFDYASQAELHLPFMRTHPRDADAHTEEVVALLPSLLQAELGALVLFASARQMQQVAKALPKTLQAAVLVQGSTSKRELLERHKTRIDQGQTSILFGLASLAEGVDLPGAYCTHVIVVKLPFAVPDDPLEQARREWIESQGRSAFLERSVPEVGIRLSQAVGRLLRTPEDHGRVTVLDSRLGSTPWGRRLLAGLPPFKVVRGRAILPPGRKTA